MSTAAPEQAVHSERREPVVTGQAEPDLDTATM